MTFFFGFKGFNLYWRYQQNTLHSSCVLKITLFVVPQQNMVRLLCSEIHAFYDKKREFQNIGGVYKKREFQNTEGV